MSTSLQGPLSQSNDTNVSLFTLRTANDPNTDPALNEDRARAQAQDPHGKPGVHVPSGDVLDKLETPKSKEELEQLSAKLNQ